MKNTDGAAVVKDGKVVDKGNDPDAYVKCDRCGRQFLVKYIYCVCKG